MTYIFDAKKEIENICSFIKDYYNKNNLKGVVLGISGGKDSAVVAALFTKALGKENVVGLTLPCHSRESDKKDAELLSKTFGFQLLNINLTSTYDSFINEVNKLNITNETNTINSNINLKPRLRMNACYYMAALLSEINKGTYIVAGTSNASELYVGYFTKGGDSTHDIEVISYFTVEEVIKLGEELNVPDHIIHKTPDDGLSNMSDEEKMGLKYKDIDAVVRGKNINQEIENKINLKHKNSLHKFCIPSYKPF